MKKFGLSRTERIRSKNEFDLLYSNGKVLISANQKLKAVYFFDKNCNSASCPNVKVAFAVHRKAGKAVWRNRVKRLLRVSYRLNKESIVNSAKAKNKFLFIALSPYSVNSKNYKNISLNDLLPDVIELLNLIRQKI